MIAARPSRRLLSLLAITTATCTAPVPRPHDTRASSLPANPYASLERVIAAARRNFRREAALDLVRVADRGFRTRGNAAFVAVLDAVERHLVAAGFAQTPSPGVAGAAWVSRETLVESGPIWDARSASLEVLEPRPEQLLAFDERDDTNRTMLVAFSDGGDVQGELVRAGPSVQVRGKIVLTDQPADEVADDFARAGALAVLSSHVRPFNDTAHHPETVRYEILPGPGPRGVPVMNVSPAVDRRLRDLEARGKVVLRARADVVLHTGRTETLIARIEGRDERAAPVLVVTHADEPGANDNGSGVGAMAETLATYLRLLREGTLPPPVRSVVFLFGMEIEMSARWTNDHRDSLPAFALSVDMAGEAPELSPMLIERMPDPGARRVRPPDAHTAWGAARAPQEWHHGTFLNAYAIAVMNRIERGWSVRDHPYEGGSDHVPFLARGVPALLLWHFPDDAYHTNRDRLARVSADEMARVGAGVLALVAHGAAAGEREALELLAINERYALARLRTEIDASLAELARAPTRGPMRDAVLAQEREHLGDWERYFDEALQSCARFLAVESPLLPGAIESARARVRAAFDHARTALR